VKVRRPYTFQMIRADLRLARLLRPLLLWLTGISKANWEDGMRGSEIGARVDMDYWLEATKIASDDGCASTKSWFPGFRWNIRATGSPRKSRRRRDCGGIRQDFEGQCVAEPWLAKNRMTPTKVCRGLFNSLC
jgi:hypothetical protein